MEAAAAALPVISTCCGDTVNLIEHKRTGFLVSSDDPLMMTAYLKLLLAEPKMRHAMGMAGRDKMQREFSLETMVKRMTAIYDEALATTSAFSDWDCLQ